VLPVAALLALAVRGSVEYRALRAPRQHSIGREELVRWIRMAATLIMGQENALI
jgi:hypothetical protein